VDDGAGTNPSLATDIDANNDGVIDGSQFATWAVNDSVAMLLGGATLPNFGYAAVSFRPTGSSGTGTGATVTYSGAWIGGYAGRVGNSTGDNPGDWLISDAQATVGTGPSTWQIPANTFTGATGTFVGKLWNSQTARSNSFVNAINDVQVN